VNLTRALLCELLSEKILRRYNEHNPGPKGLLKLANILVAGFEPFQNAPEEVLKNSSRAMHWADQRKGSKHESKLTALEVAIVSEAKSFLASSACQKVVDAIYRGKVVYTPSSFIDIISDHWKRRPISLYDPRRGPLLNQYRLIVPRTRNVIEVCQFVVLLGLYMAVMAQRETRKTTNYTIVEAVFDVYGAGWVWKPSLSDNSIADGVAGTGSVREYTRAWLAGIHPKSVVVLRRHVLVDFHGVSWNEDARSRRARRRPKRIVGANCT